MKTDNDNDYTVLFAQVFEVYLKCIDYNIDPITLWEPAEYNRVYESLFEELPDDSPQVVGPTPPTTPPPSMGIWASS